MALLERVSTLLRANLNDLIDKAEDIQLEWLESVEKVAITAGASAPEVLVREVVDRLATRFTISERETSAMIERMTFKLPRGLAA